MFFSLSSWAVALIIFALIATVTGAGVLLGRHLREHHETLREPFGVLQGPSRRGRLDPRVGLSLAVAATRIDGPRWSPTQTRSGRPICALNSSPSQSDRSLTLLRQYTDLAIRMSHEVPNSAPMQRTTAAEDLLQRQLWSLAGQAIGAAPIASAPRLYVDALNAMIDAQTVRL